MVLNSPGIAEITVKVDAGEVVREHDRLQLLGTNAGLWYKPHYLNQPNFKKHFQIWSPTRIRIPGGTWSNEVYWNGNGVRQGDVFDHSRLKGNIWQVDYSDYAPGFRLHDVNGHLSDFHGHVDIQRLHEFVQTSGAEAVVSVNAGTGTPEMAAEWVKFARKHGYAVSHWEIGNELDGDWEIGHYLPDGSRMTGELYAQRFLKFAEAMKAVDPGIKVGGPVSSSEALILGEDLVRIAGDQMDFFSFHSYPVKNNVESFNEALDATKGVVDTVAQIRGWFQKYHPDRADQIEIGLTEWNQNVAEDQNTVEMGNGIWCAAYLGRMMEAGVDFANQWDLFSVTEDGAHGVFLKNREMAPTSAYWALYLWKYHMHDQLVKTSVPADSGLTVFTTRSQNRLSVMLINADVRQDRRVVTEINGIRVKEARRVEYSAASYTWNPHTHQPAWSVAPLVEPWDHDSNSSINVPPMSVAIVEYRIGGEPFVSTGEAAVNPVQMEILLPKMHPTDLPLHGKVLLRDTKTGAGARGRVQQAKLSVTGPAELVHNTTRLAEGAGAFRLNVTGTGKITVRAKGGSWSKEVSVQAQPVLERPEVFWTFDGSKDDWGMTSSFRLVSSEQAMPNQQVAEIQLQQVTPVEHHDQLLHIEPLPEKLNRRRIGGVTFKIKATPDLKFEHAEAMVVVVLQSNANHWVPIGNIPLKKLGSSWQQTTFKLKKPEDLAAMSQAYALRLQLWSDGPVDGAIYVDDLGFILRGAAK